MKQEKAGIPEEHYHSDRLRLPQKGKNHGTDFQPKGVLGGGDFLRNEKSSGRAFAFSMQTTEYEQILSSDLSGLIFEDIGRSADMATHIAQCCPGEIKKRHLLSMLRIAWVLLTAGNFTEFDILMDELHGMLEEAVSQESQRLRGEWLLLSAWRCLPRLDEMSELVRQAASLFGKTASRVILPSAPWCFGDYSQLAVFHTKPGEGDLEADALEEYIALYSKLTNGHGSGADALFRAELAHYRGNLNWAEIQAHKANYLAERNCQGMIQLGAALHLAEIAVEKSDMTGWQRTIDSMEGASFISVNNFVLRSNMDILRSLLLNELRHQERIDDWLKNGETSGRILPAMRRNALFVRLTYLMHEGEFARLAGMAEAERQTLKSTDVLADILFSLLAAVGFLRLGDTARAESLAMHAVETALSDGFVYLLAVYYWMLQGLPEKLIHRHYPEHVAHFIGIKERFIAGYTRLRGDLSPSRLPESLTPREREVAHLAAKGLRSGEIAAKLIVSESTVRTHLRAIFQKLDIDRRAKLADMLRK